MLEGKSGPLCAASSPPAPFLRAKPPGPTAQEPSLLAPDPGSSQRVPSQGRGRGGRRDSPSLEAAGRRGPHEASRARLGGDAPSVPGCRVCAAPPGWRTLPLRKARAAEGSRWVWSPAGAPGRGWRAGGEGGAAEVWAAPAPGRALRSGGAVPGRARSSSATRPSPGRPRRCPAGRTARPPREPRAPRRRRRQRGRPRPLQPAGVRGAGGGGARGGVAAGGRAGVRAGPAPPSVPPRLRCPASSRLRHRHTPTKHPPPCVRPGWRAELSPARFFLFDPSPLWLGGGGRRGMGARVGKGVKIDEDDGSF